MNKAELTEFVVAKVGGTKAGAERAVNAVLDGIREALEKGDTVTLVGFGSFKVVDRKARVGREPKSGKKINIPAKKVPKFHAGKAFKEIVNK